MTTSHPDPGGPEPGGGAWEGGGSRACLGRGGPGRKSSLGARFRGLESSAIIVPSVAQRTVRLVVLSHLGSAGFCQCHMVLASLHSREKVEESGESVVTGGRAGTSQEEEAGATVPETWTGATSNGV